MVGSFLLLGVKNISGLHSEDGSNSLRSNKFLLAYIRNGVDSLVLVT